MFQVSLAGFCGRIRRSLAHRVPVQEQQFFAAATGPAVADHSEVTTTSEHGAWARLATSWSKFLFNKRLIIFACFFFHSFPHHRSACASLDRGCGPCRGPCLSAAPCIPLCRAGRPRAGAGLVPIHRRRCAGGCAIILISSIRLEELLLVFFAQISLLSDGHRHPMSVHLDWACSPWPQPTQSCESTLHRTRARSRPHKQRSAKHRC